MYLDSTLMYLCKTRLMPVAVNTRLPPCIYCILLFTNLSAQNAAPTMMIKEVYFQLEAVVKFTFVIHCSARKTLCNASASSQISPDDLLHCCVFKKLQHAQNAVSKLEVIYAGRTSELAHLETLGSSLQSSREVQALGPLSLVNTAP